MFRSLHWRSPAKFALLAIAVALVKAGAADWKPALPGWTYEFPRDHGPHRDFKTEWLYFTGNVRTATGKAFGYQLTFFRHGVRPPEEAGRRASRFVISDFKFAHCAVSDIGGRQFSFQQKLSRGAFGDAGFGDGGRLAWIDQWNLRQLPGDGFAMAAGTDNATVELQVTPVKKPVIHGVNGVSQKAPGEGEASHYYSIARMRTKGRITVEGRGYDVEGETWFDHEWSSNALASNQVGWDWCGLHLSDQTELMIYQMRMKDGGTDPASSGTFVTADGTATHLTRAAFHLTPLAWWKSPATGAKYPIKWRIQIPSEAIDITIAARLENQELVLPPITYWEGAVTVEGMRAGEKVGGHGYLELTGYAAKMTAMQRGNPGIESASP